MARRTISALILALSAMASWATAATWRIEKDGSGDFTVIQSAMAVVAPGDTIRIGPGRFSEKFPFGIPTWQRQVCVIAPFADLTFIGAGAKTTFIGDAVPPSDYEHDIGIGIYTATGAGALRIHDIGFDTFYFGLELDDLAHVLVERCRFAGCYTSIEVRNVGELEISNGDFAPSTTEMWHTGHVQASGHGKVIIDGTRFETRRIHLGSHTHVRSTGLEGLEVTASTFVGGAVGVYVDGTAQADIRGCTFDGQFLYGILHHATGGIVRASDTRMLAQYTALASLAPNAQWAVDNIDVEDVMICSLSYSSPMTGHVRNSRLAKGDRVIVDAYFGSVDYPPMSFDMRHNWWGTAAVDSIEAWIVDGRDVPGGDFLIEWQPFRDNPVATRSRSLGGVKAAFR